ncbi:permease [Kribbella turkmenica]|uniref:Permease n=1 Tax=Kribbella turkmenica TaxID=2530375 RepID=A0A4R4WFQ6_9ACTN|nr:permease [Kribbella turkmenica]TDD17809.1 permease [Kribbella turkmenica]
MTANPTAPPPVDSEPPDAEKKEPAGSSIAFTATLVLLVGLALFGRRIFAGWFTDEGIRTWATMFVGVTVQAIPFLVLGVLLSAALTAFIPPSFFARALPKRPALAVPVASASGVVLPGCECASVPVSAALMNRGVTPAAAIAFLLSAPAINPVVLASTAVAFPGQPKVVAARAVTSLGVSMILGWLFLATGRGASWLRMPKNRHAEGTGKFDVFRSAMLHDFLHAGGFLVIGAAAAATLNVVVPRSWLDHVAGNLLLSVVILGLLAVLLAICSEADAFVAASLTQFSLTAKLAFMVVGPVVDVKLIALQTGTFGPRFAARFAPATFVVAILASLLVGWWLL